jgi:hypothetical protein
MDVLGFHYYVKFNQCLDNDIIVWLEKQKKEKHEKDLSLLKAQGIPITIVKGEIVLMKMNNNFLLLPHFIFNFN